MVNTYLGMHNFFLSGPSYPPSRASLFELRHVGGCRPHWVAQSLPLFAPYSADCDGVSAIGVCRIFVSRCTQHCLHNHACMHTHMGYEPIVSMHTHMSMQPVMYMNESTATTNAAIAAVAVTNRLLSLPVFLYTTATAPSILRLFKYQYPTPAF